jgi:hypothetical protein
MPSSKDKTRQERLNALQERHGELTREKNRISRATNKRVTEINKELKRLGGAIYDLKNIDGDTPHITDHAVVRYLERVKGMDIWELKAEIMNYKSSVRIDNVIVTVNPDEEETHA